jgi:hypothetical protein
LESAIPSSLQRIPSPLLVRGPVLDPIEIVIGTDGGQIRGTVRSDSQQLLATARVVLIPEQRERHDLYKLTIPAPNGKFLFEAVRPGSYRLFAWDDIGQNSWFDPAVLVSYESQGIPITVDPSGEVRADLRIILAARHP